MRRYTYTFTTNIVFRPSASLTTQGQMYFSTRLKLHCQISSRVTELSYRSTIFLIDCGTVIYWMSVPRVVDFTRITLEKNYWNSFWRKRYYVRNVSCRSLEYLLVSYAIDENVARRKPNNANLTIIYFLHRLERQYS